jgi:hypothetical protein
VKANFETVFFTSQAVEGLKPGGFKLWVHWIGHVQPHPSHDKDTSSAPGTPGPAPAAAPAEHTPCSVTALMLMRPLFTAQVSDPSSTSSHDMPLGACLKVATNAPLAPPPSSAPFPAAPAAAPATPASTRLKHSR